MTFLCFLELEKESNVKNTLSYMLPSILEKTMKNQLDGLSASISLNVEKQIANVRTFFSLF